MEGVSVALPTWGQSTFLMIHEVGSLMQDLTACNTDASVLLSTTKGKPLMVDSNRMNEYGAGLLQRIGYKEPEPPVVEEMAFFDIQYALDHDEPSGGYYHACYQQTWDTDSNGDLDELRSMESVVGETVMKVIGELMTVLGRPIKADEWEFGYDEREDERGTPGAI